MTQPYNLVLVHLPRPVQHTISTEGQIQQSKHSLEFIQQPVSCSVQAVSQPNQFIQYSVEQAWIHMDMCLC